MPFPSTANSTRPASPSFAPPLPYEYDALAPVISADTLRVHHLKHQQGYADKLNELLATSDLRGKSLQEIIFATAGDPKQAKIFNNACADLEPQLLLAEHAPARAAAGRPASLPIASRPISAASRPSSTPSRRWRSISFGSGWAWLTLDGQALRLVGTGNAETPLSGKQLPLLTIDVWEHAYYLDYQNRRPDYATAWLEKVANWEFAAANLAKA